MKEQLAETSRESLLARGEQLESLVLALQTELATLREANRILRAENEELRQRCAPADTPAEAPPSVAGSMLKAKRGRRQRKAEGEPRAKRAQGYARRRSEPTRREEHVIEQCKKCGTQMQGGTVKRTREVLHIPLTPVEVIEHVFIERRCPCCGLRQTPGAEVLAGEVMGQHRVSIQVMALIATLHEELRLPIGLIQWGLQAFFRLELSQGELVEILHDVAAWAEPVVEELKEQVRTSPVVHADEATWRENGRSGYIWSLSTPEVSYLAYSHSRSGQMVEDVLGANYSGVLVSDFYSAYSRHEGRHQRCWVHLLRDMHELKEKYPDEEQVQTWGIEVHALYLQAIRYAEHHRDALWGERADAKRAFEAQLMRLCEPYLKQDVPQRVLCQRCQRFMKELFVFVIDPRVPSDNNAAERAVRPVAVCRKISGGTRSPQGSKTKGALATLFGTWRLQNLNPFLTCYRLLSSPPILN